MPSYFADNAVCENEKYTDFSWDNKSIRDSQFYKCTFDKINFQYTELKHCSFEECVFSNCNCSLMKLHNVRFTGTQFRKSKLLGINWSTVNKLFTVKFIHSNLNSAVFSDLNLTKFVFEECSLEDAAFFRVSLASAVFQNCCLKNCVFSDADLSNTDFSTSYEYFISSERNKFRKTVFSLPEAVRLLKNFDIILQ